jgi:hypothetical protein
LSVSYWFFFLLLLHTPFFEAGDGNISFIREQLWVHEKAVDWKIMWSNNFPLIASYRLHKLNAGSEWNEKNKKREATSERNWKWSSRCDLLSRILINFLSWHFSYHSLYAPCFFHLVKVIFPFFLSIHSSKEFNLHKMIPLRVENVHKHSVS